MLTDAKLKALKAGAKPYKVADALGLHVLVTKTGARLWRFNYAFEQKQKTLALGAYPDVPLIEARELRDAAKKALREGVDPAAAQAEARRAAKISADITLRVVAEEWLALKKSGWAETYYSRVEGRVNADIIGRLGKRPIAEISATELLDALRKVEKRGAVYSAHRIKNLYSEIFRYGIITERCARDPAADLRGALQRVSAAKHRAALQASDLPAFMTKLEGYEGDALTRFALKLTLFTFVRTGETRFAKWSEFDNLDEAAPLWRIPAERMKMRREHFVPLAPQVVTLLQELRKVSGHSELLFPSALKRGAISENTMIYGLYRMGYHSRATVHGFRGTASTILNEQGFNPDWVEMQLAHVQGGVRGAYNAAQWLAGRTTMMRWWADYLEHAAGRAPKPALVPANDFDQADKAAALQSATLSGAAPRCATPDHRCD